MSIISTIKKTMRSPAKEKDAPEKKERASQGAPRAGASFSSTLIAHPYLTEKSSLLQARHNAYVFKVHRSATANEIKKAVQRIFSVSVERVNMANMPSKKIRLGAREGRIPGFRKAIVTLKKGDKIDIGA